MAKKDKSDKYDWRAGVVEWVNDLGVKGWSASIVRERTNGTPEEQWWVRNAMADGVMKPRILVDPGTVIIFPTKQAALAQAEKYLGATAAQTWHRA